MGVYWARPTLEDIAAQRDMIERGEEKRRAARQAEERERIRDTFSAAALTGIMASDDRGDAVARSWKLSGAMLREREQTNHDAVPDAIANADGEPAPKCGGEAGLSSRDGTGNTPTLTAEEREAIYDGLYCLNIFCNARQSNDVLAVSMRGAAETLRSLLHRLEGER